jgi:pimeloyl-ACP methyl ester carboxylesterase
MIMHRTEKVDSFLPYFGFRRESRFEELERIDFPSRDGTPLILHRTSGGNRGPVILSPGTAMTALSYCVDSVQENLVEFLVARGFDVWLFDWRTSPLLAAHKHPYTFDDVARYDWPAAVDEVTRRTGADRVLVLAHCLSSPCLLLSLVRGYLPASRIQAIVASQVALHLVLTNLGRMKLATRVDRLLPAGEMMHQIPADVSSGRSDSAVSFLAAVLPRAYSCDNPACYRQSATFGDLIQHSNVGPSTHFMMGELVPECVTGFLRDVAVWARRIDVLTDDDRKHLDRLRLPITLVSGSLNRMFVPESTQLTYDLLERENGAAYYDRILIDGYGHLDCYIGDDARTAVWPRLVDSFARAG